jgi:hypothetical protein
MGLISRVPGGYYDVTDHAGLNTASKYNGTDAVDAALASAINYAAANDLTALLPRNTRFQLTNTLAIEDLISTGHHTSPGAISMVGQQGGTTPELFLGNVAATLANGFSRTAVLAGNANSKPLVHFYKNDVLGGAYPPASEDTETMYAATIQGVKLNGNGFANCSVLHFDAAQDCVLSDVVIDATGCYAGLTGWPGRGVQSRNIEIIGGKYGVYQKHPYMTEGSSSAIGLGGGFINFYLHGQTSYGIWVQASRGALSITGLRLEMTQGVGLYTRSVGTPERGHLQLWDSLVTVGGGIAIQASNARVSVYNSYFKNAATILDSVETTEPDYAGNANGWFYVKRFVNSPTTGSIANRLVVDGVQTTNDIVDNANGNVAVEPDLKITTQHYWREPDFTDPAQVIWATDHAGTASPWTSTTAACTPVLSSDLTTNNKTPIDAKIAECVTAGKYLFFPRGAANGQGYYPVGGAITLPSTFKGIIGGVCKRITFPPTSAWRTSQTASGTQSWVFEMPDNATATTCMAYMCIPTLFDTAARIGMLQQRAGKAVISHCWGSNQPSGRLDYPNEDIVITGNGGGRHIAVRNGGSTYNNTAAKNAADTTARRWLAVRNTTLPLTIYGCDPEFGGAPDRTPVHPALVLFDNAKNFRVLGSKSEAWQFSYEIKNGSQGYIGPIGQLIAGAAPLPSNPVMGLFSIDATSAVEVVGATKVKSSTMTYDMTTVPLFAEGAGISPLSATVHAGQSLAYYSRGALLDPETVWKSYSDTPPPAPSSYAISSTVWIVYFEGADPSVSPVAVAEIELAETVGGPDISGTATAVTASSGGANVANIRDNNDATDFTGTASVAVKFTFASPVVISELRWKPSASAASVPVSTVVEIYDASISQLRRIAARQWPATQMGVRVVRFNGRAGRAGLAQRARTKTGALVT